MWSTSRCAYQYNITSANPFHGFWGVVKLPKSVMDLNLDLASLISGYLGLPAGCALHLLKTWFWPPSIEINCCSRLWFHFTRYTQLPKRSIGVGIIKPELYMSHKYWFCQTHSLTVSKFYNEMYRLVGHLQINIFGPAKVKKHSKTKTVP